MLQHAANRGSSTWDAVDGAAAGGAVMISYSIFSPLIGDGGSGPQRFDEYAALEEWQ
jgi:hypothetical protein